MLIKVSTLIKLAFTIESNCMLSIFIAATIYILWAQILFSCVFWLCSENHTKSDYKYFIYCLFFVDFISLEYRD